MSSEPTKWEPSEASIAEYHKMRFRVWGRGGDHAEETKLALKAAVAADPLLSAAAEMRDALLSVREFVQDELDNRDCAGGDATDYVNDARRALEIIDGAIAKAKGV